MCPVTDSTPEAVAFSGLPNGPPPDSVDRVLPQGYRLLGIVSRTTGSLVMRVLDERSGQAAVLKRSTQTPVAPLNIRALGVQCPGILLPRRTWSEADATYELLDWVDSYTLESIMQHAHVPVRGALLDHWVTTLVELVVPLHSAHPPIIHRDITPSNVVVATEDLSLWLIDTSSACFGGQTQHPAGSPSYAPREQLEGNAVPASDIYSIGALAYHLAMQRLPPSFASREQALKRRASHGDPRDATCNPHLAIETGGLQKLGDWIELMLQLIPVARPRDADNALALKRPENTLVNKRLGTLTLPNGRRVVMNLLDFHIELQEERTSQ